jgi:hypothetical protein
MMERGKFVLGVPASRYPGGNEFDSSHVDGASPQTNSARSGASRVRQAATPLQTLRRQFGRGISG